jgi:type II secretory pathway pseudopilin PulG
MMMNTARPSADRGFTIAEMMLSVVMMSVLVIGMVTIVIVQARQQVRIKLDSDMMTYAELLLDEAEMAIGGAEFVIKNATSGGTSREVLEYNFLGTENVGSTLDTRFVQEGERKVIVTRNNQRVDFAERFPPPELDPNKNRDLRYRIRVDNFRVRNYDDRLSLNSNVFASLAVIELKLRMEDDQTGYEQVREFRRVVCAPNVFITTKRRAES